MIFLRIIQLINVFVMLGAMCVKTFGTGEKQEKAGTIWMVSLILCWVFILVL
mgnify:CR=1 FL=1